MKIAIATDDFKTITGHIGRCNGFIIYEIEDNKIAAQKNVENDFTNHRKGQRHHGNHEQEHSNSHAGLLEGLNGCTTLICSAAGWRVVEDLKNNGIDVVFTSEKLADEAAIKFASGNLDINDDGVCRSH